MIKKFSFQAYSIKTFAVFKNGEVAALLIIINNSFQEIWTHYSSGPHLCFTLPRPLASTANDVNNGESTHYQTHMGMRSFHDSLVYDFQCRLRCLKSTCS